MKPKDKAKELFEKFQKPVDLAHKYPMCFDTAKQSAIIAVDEIIQAMDNVMLPNPFKQYWNKVKQEIEKI